MNATNLTLLLAAALAPRAALAQAPEAPAPEFDVPWIGYETSIYPEGVDSWGSRAADFDGDGVADLAVTSWPANPRLSILLSDGQGAYSPPVLHTLPLASVDLEVADFDRDGDLDIAVSDTGRFWEGNTISLFTNLGNGTFFGSGTFASGNGPSGLASADFDGDGWPDLAVAHDAYINFGNSMAVLLNDGAGGFRAPRYFTLQSGTNMLRAGDLDGDGDADIVVGHETNRITVLMNDGAAGFGPGIVYGGIPSSSIFLYPTVLLGDPDKDGDLDVFYSSIATGNGAQGNYGAVALYRNPGNGSLAAPQTVNLLQGINGGTGLELADVTGDGWPDLMAATEGSQYWCLVPGDGSGGFLSARGLRCGESPFTLHARHLDGDGDLDMVVVARDSLEACVYLNPGAGAFVQPPVVDMVDPAMAPVSFSNLQVGDLDGDGDLDLVVGYSANFQGTYGVSVRRNNGDGTFAARENWPAPYFPAALELADLNGDGWDDLLWLEDDFSPRFRYRFNQGNGTFGSMLSSQSTFCGGEDSAIQAHDVNGDGRLDVVVGGCYGSVSISLQLPSGFFGAKQDHSVGGVSRALELADIDGDLDLDLATPTGPHSYVEISLGNGDGTFQTPFFVNTGRAVRAIRFADVDGDGILDLASVHELDGNGMAVNKGRGDGSFRPPEIHRGSYSSNVDSVNALLVADTDGDGDLDLLAPNYGSQDFSLWRNRSDGTFDEHVRYGVGQRGTDVALADFDGDGAAELAVLVQAISGWYWPGVVLIDGSAPPPPQTYCTAQTNSQGCTPAIGSTGAPSATAGSGFVITLHQTLNNKHGLLFFGTAGPHNIPFQGGTLCVRPPLRRTAARNSGGNPPPNDCSGVFAIDFNQRIASDPSLAAGVTVWSQWWSRDPQAASGTNLSDGLTFTIGD